MKIPLVTLFVYFFVGEVYSGTVTAINESSVCSVKKSCLQCLRLPQCTWCEETGTCFSTAFPDKADFCKDNAKLYVDYGMSFEDNAKCTCIGDKLEQNCNASIETEEVCSNRGKCECGRCVCDIPDLDRPNKVIIGEYCEYDNFSCDGPQCHEGPYHFRNMTLNLKTTT